MFFHSKIKGNYYESWKPGRPARLLEEFSFIRELSSLPGNCITLKCHIYSSVQMRRRKMKSRKCERDESRRIATADRHEKRSGTGKIGSSPFSRCTSNSCETMQVRERSLCSRVFPEWTASPSRFPYGKIVRSVWHASCNLNSIGDRFSLSLPLLFLLARRPKFRN